MKGWVYVISNRAMPGLVKVGFSTKDPELRAGELSHTGSPHPYVVEYEVLVEGPQQIEGKTHRHLSPRREAKEWFRCTPEEAIVAIKHVCGAQAIVETYKRAEREKAEALHRRELHDLEVQKQERQVAQEVESRLIEEESDIRDKYQRLFDTEFPKSRYWPYLLGGLVISNWVISWLFPHIPEGPSFIGIGLGGALLGVMVRRFLEKQQVHSPKYVSLVQRRVADIEMVRVRFFPCPKCGKSLRFERARLLAPIPRAIWRCPTCRTPISPLRE